MKKIIVLITVIMVFVVLMSCAPGPNQLTNSPDEEGELAGFWKGLWHGLIAPISFIISLFSDNVRLYEVHNNGNWYNLGFILGMAIIFGGGGSGAGSRSRD